MSLARTLHELIGAQHVALYRQITDHDGCTLLQPTASAGSGMGMPDASECPGCRALTDYPQHARCVQEDQTLALADGTRLFPVHGSGDAVIGLLEIGGKALAAWDAHLASVFLRIFRNYLALLEDSERDTLTGLLNRKTFDRNIARILARLVSDVPAIGPAPERRHLPPAERCHWLAVMDVDHFNQKPRLTAHWVSEPLESLGIPPSFEVTQKVNRLSARFARQAGVWLCRLSSQGAALRRRYAPATRLNLPSGVFN